MLLGHATRTVLHPIHLRFAQTEHIQLRETGEAASLIDSGPQTLARFSSQSAREARVDPIPYAGAPLRRIDDYRSRGNLGLQFATGGPRNVGSSWLMGSSSSGQANSILGTPRRDGQHPVVRQHAQIRDSPQSMGGQPSIRGNSKCHDSQFPTTHARTPRATPLVTEAGNLHRGTLPPVSSQSIRRSVVTTTYPRRLEDQSGDTPTPVGIIPSDYQPIRRQQQQGLRQVQQRIRVSWLLGDQRATTRLASFRAQFLESSSQIYSTRREQDLPRRGERNAGQALLSRSAMVHKIAPFGSAARFRRRRSLPPANLGPEDNARSSVEIGRLENLAEEARTLPLTVTLQQSLLTVAGAGATTGGTTIARLMPKARAPNKWRSNEILWKKWLVFCSQDGIDPLSGNEGAVLRYLGWLFEENKISAGSVRSYLSAVTTAHTRIGRSLALTPLIQLTVDAFQQGDRDLKLLSDALTERRALPSLVARRIFALALTPPDTDLEFLRNACAILVSYIFFERGEAGVSLLLTNITVNPDSIKIAIALRKNRNRVAHTLAYRRNPRFDTSVIDLVRRYDTLRRSNRSGSKYYWALDGTRLSTSAITLWLQFCLARAQFTPPPQVSWSSKSLRMGATSECAGIGVQ